jgi:hypothetical protein
MDTSHPPGLLAGRDVNDLQEPLADELQAGDAQGRGGSDQGVKQGAVTDAPESKNKQK